MGVRRVASRFAAWMLDGARATYGLAIMRIMFGAMTLVLLALYLPSYSYSFGQASRWGWSYGSATGVNNYPWPLPFPFSIQDDDGVLLVKMALLAAVALLYMLGWRMRIVSPLFVYLWLGFSTLNPTVLNTGHYQTFRVLIIFMLFADLSRRWSLDERRRRKNSARGRGNTGLLRIPGLGSLPRWVPNLFNNAAVLLIGAQICIIYVMSAWWKLRGTMWIDGTASYYALRIDELQLIPWVNDLAWSLPAGVFVASWLAVYGQLFFPLMLLNRWTRILGLVIVTGMHAAIGILLALPFFSLTMIAADMIFIRDVSWRKAADWVRKRLPVGRSQPQKPPYSRRSVAKEQATS